MLFDIVICVGPNDNDVVEKNVYYCKQNIVEHRNIYLVCSNPNINIDGAITIDEKIFPFNINDVENFIGKRQRCGWYLQQLLKIYSGKTITGILESYLIIDCDTFFLKPTRFITDDNKFILTTGTEYHRPYFTHMNKLHPSLSKIHPLSGISHHTMFNTILVQEMIDMIENHNQNKSFWKLYLENISPVDYDLSGAAENEMYFTYLYVYHKDKIQLRTLKWINTDKIILNGDHDFISYHWYLRR